MSRRYSPDEKSAILAEFREQSASAAAFCRARGLSVKSQIETVGDYQIVIG